MQGQIGKPTIKLWCARATECERRRMSGRERERDWAQQQPQQQKLHWTVHTLIYSTNKNKIYGSQMVERSAVSMCNTIFFFSYSEIWVSGIRHTAKPILRVSAISAAPRLSLERNQHFSSRAGIYVYWVSELLWHFVKVGLLRIYVMYINGYTITATCTLYAVLQFCIE